MNEALTTIEQFIKNKIGIDSQIMGRESMVHFVGRRMESAKIRSYSAYLEVIENHPEELQALINLITIPETWFFRDREPFIYLRQYIEENWLSPKNTEFISILSVPCSTGEEPYSIAMVLTDCGLLPHQFHIDAYDINSISLAKAKKAMYGGNSFRGYDSGFRDKYFNKLDGSYCLNKSIAETVNFYHGNAMNILEETTGRLYNVIFCRNLLIYYDMRNQEILLSQLRELLLNDGRLFLGHAESSEPVLSLFANAGEKGSFSFKKRMEGDAWFDVGGHASISRQDSLPSEKMTKNTKSTAAENAVSFKRKVRDLGPVDNGLIRDIERKADNGHLDEAASLCALLVEQGVEDAKALCLCGVINEVRGDIEQATALFKRAIEADPDHYEATVHLAENLEIQGLSSAASALRDRAKIIASKKG